MGSCRGDRMKVGGRRRTALALGRVAELLETGADLLGCPALAGNVEDVVRDEFVAHGEATERAGCPRLDGLVLLEAWGGRDDKSDKNPGKSEEVRDAI